MVQNKDVHLVILIHGLWGSPQHLAAAKEELEDAWAGTGSYNKDTTVTGPSEDVTITDTVKNAQGEELVVVVAGGMTSQLTYDGIDVCASRVAWEVDEQISKLEDEGKRVTRFSVTGYSLGGLVARYLVGLLHSRTPSFFEQHQPVSFSTIATPHYGIPRYSTFLSTVLHSLGGRLLSRSGEQLYVNDRYSDEDPRPLLEMMADPSLVFYHALEEFPLVQIFANGINDNTVPYPTAAFDTVDPFVEWTEQGLEVDVDEDGLIESWKKPEITGKAVVKKKGWGFSVGKLPPVLQYRFPFNYIILILFPIMLPVIVVLMMARLSLDTRRSRGRLQRLARTSTPGHVDGIDSPRSPIPSASGLSVQHLRQAIRRMERSIESPLIESVDAPEAVPLLSLPEGEIGEAHEVTVKLRLSDSQIRMATWLKGLPVKKYTTWYPDVTNSHSVIVVRDPIQYPIHNRGRGVLRKWAKGVLGK